MSKLLIPFYEKKLPALYHYDENTEKTIANIKFFSQFSNWEWYAAEYNPKEKVFFGLVKGYEIEIGYFTLHELENSSIPILIYSEFEPQPIEDIQKKLEADFESKI